MSETKSRTVQAHEKFQAAARQRKGASYGSEEAPELIAMAGNLEAEASALMRPEAHTLRGGEVLRIAEAEAPAWEIRNTLRDPDQAALDASIVRTELLFETHQEILPLAIDLAQTVQADNSLEKLLAHQLAALHMLVMKTSRRAFQFEMRISTHEVLPQPASIELGRLTNSIARLSGTFQEGLLALERIKRGASQTVTVRHVTVEAGAQAVIGAVSGGSRGARRAGARRKKSANSMHQSSGPSK